MSRKEPLSLPCQETCKVEVGGADHVEMSSKIQSFD